MEERPIEQTKTMREKALKGACLYLERRGFEVVKVSEERSEELPDIVAIAPNEDAVAIDVSFSVESLPAEMTGLEARRRLESVLGAMVALVGMDRGCRFDHVCLHMMAVGDLSGSVVRHHMSVSGSQDETNLELLARVMPEMLLRAFDERQREWLMRTEPFADDAIIEAAVEQALWGNSERSAA